MLGASADAAETGKAGPLHAAAADVGARGPAAADPGRDDSLLRGPGESAARADPPQPQCLVGEAIALLESPDEPPADPTASPARRRHHWAELLHRVFEVDALDCPRCGGRMRILAAITDPDVARRILMCLRLPPRARPLASAASHEPAVDPWVHAPESWGFDQTVSEDWDSGG